LKVMREIGDRFDHMKFENGSGNRAAKLRKKP